MIHLLDVNVLLALGYEDHVHHERAESWLDDFTTQHPSLDLATCALTELGFIRVATGKAGFADNVIVAQADLRRLKTKRTFTFLDDGLGADRFPSWTVRSKQVTDGHLLLLAQLHYGKLVTLDRGIPGALLVPLSKDGHLEVREPAARYGAAA